MLQEGIKLDKSSPEAKKFLGALMSQMEQVRLFSASSLFCLVCLVMTMSHVIISDNSKQN